MSLILIAALAVSPGTADARAGVTTMDFNFVSLNACVGEPVEFNLVLHLVDTDGDALNDHGNWSQAVGIGQVTGTVYRGQGVSNSIPGEDGVFLQHLDFQGSGRNAAHFTMTFIGALFSPPDSIIQVHCN